MHIVLHSDDINLTSYWKKAFGDKASFIDNFEELFELKNVLIILNYSSFEKSIDDTIFKLKQNENAVLILHRTPTIEVAKKLLQHGANGYGNALMKEHFLFSAVDTIAEGLIWLHPEFISALIMQIPQTQTEKVDTKISSLSEREKEVVYLLKEGDTYKTIAQKLNITPRTVKAHASNIYQKLHVKDRLALALLLKS